MRPFKLVTLTTASVFLLVATSVFSYAQGQKQIHVDYVVAYLCPTKSMVEHLQAVAQESDLQRLQSDIAILYSALEEISWRDESTYRATVRQLVRDEIPVSRCVQ